MQDGEKMFGNFAMRFPFIAEKVVEWSENSEYDITVRLEDSSMFLYDDIEGSIRKLPSDSRSLTKDECNREFGERLMRMMRRKAVTQEELSERTGIDQAQISRYLNGKNSPSFYIVDKIAKALNCSVEYFRYIWGDTLARLKKDSISWKMIYADFESHFPNLHKKVIWYGPHSYATILITISDNYGHRDITYNYDTKEVKFV